MCLAERKRYGLFSRPTGQRRNTERVLRSETAPGIPDAILLEGYKDLGVVGESFHQDSLWTLVGGRDDRARRVRVDIIGVLTAEPDNSHDSNAVAVSIDGLSVGYLSREDARLYQPGVLDFLRRYGRPVALRGVIVGGGIREDGPGLLGVFLNHDPEDFGLPRPGLRSLVRACGRLVR
jgi:hypothetical protein